MDREKIKTGRFVERYLSGDLLMREAWEFERFCREHPDVLETLAIPARLQAHLKASTFDGMNTSVFEAMPSSISRLAAATGLRSIDQASMDKQQDMDEEEDEDPVPARTAINKYLLLLLLLSLVGLGTLYWQTQSLQRQIKTMHVAAQVSGLRAITSIQTLRASPGTSQADEPVISVSLSLAEWLDVHLDVSNSQFKVFGIQISKVNEARVLELRRISADTNQELRFSLNSTTFGNGQYEIKLQGYNYKGEASDIGWVLMDMH
jgi:hypothetical protein